MKTVDFLIIGGGIAGTTAAETLRQNSKDCSIAIISDEPYRLYSRIMLSKPNFILEKIPFDQIWLKKEQWYSENNIEFLSGRKAVEIDRGAHVVKLDGGEEIKYKRLLLAVGGHARRWTVPGADKQGVCYSRNLDETKEMMKMFKGAKRGVTIGSGFVSFETAELMKKMGMEATIIMMEPYFWYPMFDETAGRMIETAMEKEGVKFLRKSEVSEVLGGERVSGVILKDRTKVDCEMIGVGIGLEFNLDWIKKSGIATNRGIIADEFLKTNDEDIFTAGDCAEFNDLMLGERVMLGNWVNALNHGKTAAMNMLGAGQPFKLVSFYTAQAFGINISMVGDVRPGEGKKAIYRFSKKKNTYVCIMVKDGKVIGATLLNKTDELFAISTLIEKNINVSGKESQLSNPNFDLKTLFSNPMPEKDKKIKIGWFCFSCCEDNLVVFTELMNDHWQEWKKTFDFRHVRALRSKNVLDELDIVFIEGALASEEHVNKVKEIREKAKKVVTVGACAVTGMPAGQRNFFNEEQKKNVQFLVDKFHALPRVLKVSEVIKVDAEVGGCPMDPNRFLEAVNLLLKQ